MQIYAILLKKNFSCRIITILEYLHFFAEIEPFRPGQALFQGFLRMPHRNIKCNKINRPRLGRSFWFYNGRANKSFRTGRIGFGLHFYTRAGQQNFRSGWVGPENFSPCRLLYVVAHLYFQVLFAIKFLRI